MNDKEHKEMCIENEFNALKRNKKHIIYDPSNINYLQLFTEGKIQRPYEYKKEVLVQAEKIFKKELREELHRASEFQKVIVKRWIKEFKNTLEEKPKMKKKYHGLIMTLILTDYFKRGIEKGLTFKELA